MTDLPSYPPAPNKNFGALLTASAVTLAGAAVTIITYALQQLTHQTLPESVDQALLVLVEAIFAFAAHRATS